MTLVTPQPVVPFDSYTTVDPASGRASARKAAVLVQHLAKNHPLPDSPGGGGPGGAYEGAPAPKRPA